MFALDRYQSSSSNIVPNCEIWRAFCHGSWLLYIPCHWIKHCIHAISRCDTCSAFKRIGKNLAWLLGAMNPISNRWSLCDAPSKVHIWPLRANRDMLFACISEHYHSTRKQLFTQKRKMENISPTSHALEQQLHLETVTHWRSRSSIARFMGLGEMIPANSTLPETVMAISSVHNFTSVQYIIYSCVRTCICVVEMKFKPR